MAKDNLIVSGNGWVQNEIQESQDQTSQVGCLNGRCFESLRGECLREDGKCFDRVVTLYLLPMGGLSAFGGTGCAKACVTEAERNWLGFGLCSVVAVTGVIMSLYSAVKIAKMCCELFKKQNIEDPSFATINS